jgi:hypothetical protein
MGFNTPVIESEICFLMEIDGVARTIEVERQPEEFKRKNS